MNPIKKVKIFTDIDELLEFAHLPLSLESLGIEEYGEWYIRHLPEQNEKEEFKKVNDFSTNKLFNLGISILKSSTLLLLTTVLIIALPFFISSMLPTSIVFKSFIVLL